MLTCQCTVFVKLVLNDNLVGKKEKKKKKVNRQWFKGSTYYFIPNSIHYGEVIVKQVINLIKKEKKSTLIIFYVTKIYYAFCI